MNSSKKISILFIAVFVAGFLLLSAQMVYAAVPTLSVSSTGNGDYVQINVTGDPNASVILFYLNASSNVQSASIGTTDATGNFSTVISSGTYNIVSNSSVYVATGGVNGTQSQVVTWPYFQNQNVSTGGLTLSQNALLLNVGQNSVITAGASNLYLLSNSNPSIANVNLNTNQLTVVALAYGSTVANICVVGGTTNCASLSITVQNSGTSQLTFSQNNFSISPGESVSVMVSGGSGIYTISNNSNPSSIQASISGSAAVLSAQNTIASAVSAAITVCTTDMSACGILNVNLPTANSSAVSFSQTNPTIVFNQGITITILGGADGNYFVSSNSNPNIVQTNISENILTLIGDSTTAGTSLITICSQEGGCGSLTVNVTGPNNISSAPVANVFSRYLFYGVNGEDVLQLQKILVSKGFLSATPNGHFGLATVAAVKKFQKANGLSQLGAVGPATRAILNQISVSSSSTTSTTKEQQISEIQQAIQQLKTQLSALQ